VDSSHKYVAFLVCNLTWRPESLGNSLQLRCSFGIIGLELNRNFSGKMSKHPEMIFMKVNGKSQLRCCSDTRFWV